MLGIGRRTNRVSLVAASRVERNLPTCFQIFLGSGQAYPKAMGRDRGLNLLRASCGGGSQDLRVEALEAQACMLSQTAKRR